MTTDDDAPKPPEPEAPDRPGLLAVIGSVLAAGFGVQSKKNRERDFQHGKPVVFITAGIVFTVLFILSVVLVVTTVLESAG